MNTSFITDVLFQDTKTRPTFPSFPYPNFNICSCYSKNKKQAHNSACRYPHKDRVLNSPGSPGTVPNLALKVPPSRKPGQLGPLLASLTCWEQTKRGKRHNLCSSNTPLPASAWKLLASFPLHSLLQTKSYLILRFNSLSVPQPPISCELLCHSFLYSHHRLADFVNEWRLMCLRKAPELWKISRAFFRLIYPIPP